MDHSHLYRLSLLCLHDETSRCMDREGFHRTGLFVFFGKFETSFCAWSFYEFVHAHMQPQIVCLNLKCYSVPEDCSSGSTLLLEVPVYGFPVFKGLTVKRGAGLTQRRIT